MDEIAHDAIEVEEYCYILTDHICIYQCVEKRTVPDIELPGLENIPVNQSKVPQPDKSDLIAKQQTRLKNQAQ